MVRAFPALDIRRAVASRKGGDPVLGASGFRYYASARAALFHAVQAMRLPPESVVLLPAYHCGVEVEAVLRAGCRVAFYAVKADLSCDFDDLSRRMLPGTAAVLAIHYFGFSQDLSRLKALCDAKGAVLIEDCAHALYSRDSSGVLLGSVGDYALFSLQKTVALPNGGGLLVNAAGGDPPRRGARYFEISLLKSLIRSSLEFEAARDGAAGSLSRRILALRREEAPAATGEPGTAEADDLRWYYDVKRYGYGNDISSLSLPFVGKEPVEGIVSSRRRNFSCLASLLEETGHAGLMLATLEEGSCPLCLPVMVERRDEVAAGMRGRGVEPFVFGRFPHQLLPREEFPEASLLAARVLGLPVHQQLTCEEMRMVAGVFRSSLADAAL